MARRAHLTSKEVLESILSDSDSEEDSWSDCGGGPVEEGSDDEFEDLCVACSGLENER